MPTTKKKQKQDNKIVSEEKILTCSHKGCKGGEGEFYKSFSIINQYTGHLSVCKTCLGEIFSKIIDDCGNGEMALYKMAGILDIYYNTKLYLRAVEQARTQGSNVLGIYMTLINSLPQYRGKTFNDSPETDIDNIQQKIDIHKNLEDKLNIILNDCSLQDSCKIIEIVSRDITKKTISNN